MNWAIRGLTVPQEERWVLPHYLVRRAVVLFEVLLVTALAFLLLGHKSLWLDESYSIAVARDWPTIWPVMLRYEANMWLYYTLLHFWLRVGESEFIVRSLSVIFAIGTVPLIYALGSRLFGARAGLVAGLLLSLNAFFIQYAQEARSYSMLVFLTTLSAYFLVKGVERPSWKYGLGYVGCIILAIYTHFFGALVLMAHVTSLLVLYQRKFSWKGMALGGLVTLLLLLPFALFHPLGLGEPIWIQPPGIDNIRRLFEELAGGSRNLFWLYLVLCFGALGLAGTRPRPGRLSLKSWPYVFLISWLLLPVVIAFITSALIRPIFIDRFLIVCLPPFVLLAAVGLSKINRRWFFAGILAMLLVLSGQSLLRWYVKFEKENWREATAFVLKEAQPGDGVLFYAYFVRHPFEYYLARSGLPDDFLNLTELAAEPYNLSGGGLQPEPDLELLERLPGEHARVWLILSHDQIPNLGREEQRRLIQNSLERHYRIIQQQEFKAIRVLLYERAAHEPEQ